MKVPSFLLCALALSSSSLAQGNPPVDSGIPLVFVENRGQFNDDARFVARAPGFQGRFHETGFEFLLEGEAGVSRVGLEFLGAENVQPRGEGASLARTHYLHGEQPGGWITDVPAWEGLAYESLYPGVDLVVYSSAGRLEYDLRLQPGADLDSVRIAVRGSAELLLGPDGELVLDSPGGRLVHGAPRTWQVHADGRREPLVSRVARRGPAEFGFEVEGHDPALDLVVDPILVYSTYVGGSEADEALGVAVDSAGCLYVAGVTRSSDFPITPLAADDRAHEEEVVVFKLDPSGEKLLYATYVGGTRSDRAHALAVNDAGEVFVCGSTKSTDFPTTAGAVSRERHRGADAFVFKLDAEGSTLLFSTYLGGDGDEVAKGIAVNGEDEAFVVGTTKSSNFPTSSDALQPERRGLRDAFVTRLDPWGSLLIYSTFLGGLRDDEGNAIAIDERNHAFVTGETQSGDFPTTAEALDRRKDQNDAFVARIDPMGTELVFSTFLGGSARDGGNGIALGWGGDVFVVGESSSDDFPTTPGAFQSVAPGRGDAFVSKLAASGGVLVYSSYLGGSGPDGSRAVGVDAWGAAWVAGWSESDDFPSSPESRAPQRAGGTDGFVVQLEPSGAALGHSTLVGGPSDDEVCAVFVEPFRGTTAVAGFAKAGLETTRGVLGEQSSGLRDGFAARFDHGVCGKPARVGFLGPGCGAKLEVSAPKLGNAVRLQVHGAAPSAPGLLFMSAAGAQSRMFGGRCEVFLKAREAFVLGHFVTNLQGERTLEIKLPDDPALCGLQVVVQGAVIAPRVGPLRFGQITEGRLVVLGD